MMTKRMLRIVSRGRLLLTALSTARDFMTWAVLTISGCTCTCHNQCAAPRAHVTEKQWRPAIPTLYQLTEMIGPCAYSHAVVLDQLTFRQQACRRDPVDFEFDVFAAIENSPVSCSGPMSGPSGQRRLQCRHRLSASSTTTTTTCQQYCWRNSLNSKFEVLAAMKSCCRLFLIAAGPFCAYLHAVVLQ